MEFYANTVYYQDLQRQIRECTDEDIIIRSLYGQRYIGCGATHKRFELHGTPGNGLGQYNNGATIEVFGNCQEAVGDTMNEGRIIIHGNCGDACAYGMRGGEIFIQGDFPCGYFCGTGMHGGKIILRCDKKPEMLPKQVLVCEMQEDDKKELLPYITSYCSYFGGDAEEILSQQFYVLTPNPEVGYYELYTFE